MRGIIVKALSGFYYVEDNGEVIECRARGKFRNNDESPLVGDFVEYSLTDNQKGSVDKILPRKNMLIRPSVANIDKLFVVVSVADPKPNTFVIDKIIMNAEDKSIEPIIIINKCDLGDYEAIATIYKNAGFKVICVSASAGENISEIKPLISKSTIAFTGNTGVGKSSIINALSDNLELSTGEVSKKLGRGRHTTRHVELFSLCGGYIVDTPGFSSFDMEKCGFVHKSDIQFCFREFKDYIDNCKFTGCSHTKEKGCAVIDALNAGSIEKSRFESYCRFYEESALIPDWQLNK